MRTFFLASFLLFVSIAFPQKRDYNWCFSDSVKVSFNTLSAPVASTIILRGTLDENYASISDNSGNLLFYINGCTSNSQFYSSLFDSTQNLMLNGDSIFTDRSVTQGSLIIPDLNDSNKYLLFNINCRTKPPFGLYYSVIDMSMNGGLGAVITKNILVYNDTLTEKLTACKHGNGRDWWIITHDRGNTKFIEFLLTPFGIQGPYYQNFGSIYNDLYGTGIQGFSVFSKYSNKLCCAGTGIAVNGTPKGVLDLFDFDRCTGLLSNWVNLSINTYAYYACAFSADESKLYATDFFNNQNTLYQFNLNASNIYNSKTVILNSPINYLFLGVSLAPDNKIYIATAYYGNPNTIFNSINKNLSVIQYPDSAGLSCNILPYSFYLNGHRAIGNLPSYPNYNLGADEGSPCDSLTAINEIAHNFAFSISPNPVNGNIKIIYQLQQNNEGIFEVYDVTGKKVFSQSLPPRSTLQNFDLGFLSNGIYNCVVTSGIERVSKKLAVIKN